MSPRLSAAVSFVVVFAMAFVLGGCLLMPHLPPVPDHMVTVVELEYWSTNWAGALLGLFLGGLSARSILKREGTTEKADEIQGTS